MSTGTFLLKINTLSNSIEWSKTFGGEFDKFKKFEIIGDQLISTYYLYTPTEELREKFGILKLNASTGAFITA